MSTSIVTQTWGISLKIYLSVLHPSHTAHFPQKSLYLSLISPRQSSWQSKLRRSLCTLTSSLRIQIFFQKVKQYTKGWHPWWELDVLIFKWQLICWRADWPHIRSVSRLPHPFPSPDYCSASFTRQIYFFSFFPQCGVRSQATCSCSFPTICVRLDNSVDFFGINRMPARSCWIANISQSVGLHVSETPRAMLAGDLFPGAATHARHVKG